MLTEKYMMPKALDEFTEKRKLEVDVGVTDCTNMGGYIEPYLSKKVTRKCC